MADDEVSLLVGGVRYGGWKSIHITRSIESIAGSFALDVSDRWDGALDPWPIAEGDPCILRIDDDIILTGYVDKRGVSATADSRTLTYSGRDRSGDLVDSSALIDAGSLGKGAKWTFHNVDVAQIAAKVAEPFGIPVTVQAGLGQLLTKNAKIVLHPGDTCFEVISKIAAAAGVLVVSDGQGGIVVTRTGIERAASLVEGQNIKTASVEYDASSRFHHYLISNQIPAQADEDGDGISEAVNVQAEAFDAGVGRSERQLLIRPEKGGSIADARRRADWEARHRAAVAEKVSIGVVGWRQSSGGKLWKPNTISHVTAPRMIGVDGDLVISQVEFTVDDRGGRLTQLTLMRPDAFTPEPTATVTPSEGAWKENREL